MALIDKEIIRKEIERRLSNIVTGLDFTAEIELKELLSFLDTLPEQPVIKKSNALFDKCVENCDPAVMKEVSDNVDKMLGRPPVEDLEEAASKYEINAQHLADDKTGSVFAVYNYQDGMRDGLCCTEDAFIAGAEWMKDKDQKTIELAEDHAMLAGMNKMEQQMLEKAYDTVMQFDELDDLVPTFEDMQKFGFKVGDKVKVIILKEK